MDPILYWNDIALEANRVSHTRLKGEQRGPTLSSRALAIVHLAMYDAFVGASQAALTPYLTQKTQRCVVGVRGGGSGGPCHLIAPVPEPEAIL
jgi:hypothetical protein